MHIRRLGPADANAVASLYASVREPGASWRSDGELAARVERLLASSSVRAWGAEQDGTLVGALGVLLHPHWLFGRPVASQIAWWVEPAWRGRAVGGLLWRAARRDCPEVTAWYLCEPVPRARRVAAVYRYDVGETPCGRFRLSRP